MLTICQKHFVCKQIIRSAYQPKIKLYFACFVPEFLSIQFIISLMSHFCSHCFLLRTVEPSICFCDSAAESYPRRLSFSADSHLPCRLSVQFCRWQALVCGLWHGGRALKHWRNWSETLWGWHRAGSTSNGRCSSDDEPSGAYSDATIFLRTDLWSCPDLEQRGYWVRSGECNPRIISSATLTLQVQ